MIKAWCLALGGIVGLMAIVTLVNAALVHLLYGWLQDVTPGLPELSFTQVLLGTAILMVLFGGSHSTASKKK